MRDPPPCPSKVRVPNKKIYIRVLYSIVNNIVLYYIKIADVRMRHNILIIKLLNNKNGKTKIIQKKKEISKEVL